MLLVWDSTWTVAGFEGVQVSSLEAAFMEPEAALDAETAPVIFEATEELGRDDEALLELAVIEVSGPAI